MDIVVIRSDGSLADFWNIVMMRESFWLFEALTMITAISMAFGGGGRGFARFLLVWLNAGRIIFIEGGRTIPDKFADTVVVRKAWAR